MSRKPTKKSETIDVRVSHEVKRRLHEKCQAEDRSVSDVMRSLIDNYLEDTVERAPEKHAWRFAMPKHIQNRPRLSLAALAASILATLALAQTASADPKSAFHTIDANKDGKVSFAEYADMADTTMIFLEQDGPDLKVLTDPGAIRRAARNDFQAYDSDESGEIEPGEFTPRFDLQTRAAFYMVDLDQNGDVALSEIKAAFDLTDTSASDARRQQIEHVEAVFKRLDLDGNKTVSLQELQTIG